MALALTLSALTFMGFAGYTLALQRLFHILLEHLPPQDAKTTQRQASILPRVYIGKLNIAFALAMLVYFIASRNADWHVAVLLLLLCVLAGRLLCGIWLQPRTARMLAAVTMELTQQRAYYVWRGQTAQVQAVEGLLATIHLMQRGGIAGRTI